MHAAFNGGNAVGVAINALVVPRVPLQSNVERLVIFGGFVVAHLGEERLARLIEVLDEIDDATFVLIGDFLFLVAAIINKHHFEIFVEKGNRL